MGFIVKQGYILSSIEIDFWACVLLYRLAMEEISMCPPKSNPLPSLVNPRGQYGWMDNNFCGSSYNLSLRYRRNCITRDDYRCFCFNAILLFILQHRNKTTHSLYVCTIRQAFQIFCVKKFWETKRMNEWMNQSIPRKSDFQKPFIVPAIQKIEA